MNNSFASLGRRERPHWKRNLGGPLHRVLADGRDLRARVRLGRELQPGGLAGALHVRKHGCEDDGYVLGLVGLIRKFPYM